MAKSPFTNKKWTWISDNIHVKCLDVITHPCPSFNDGVITSHIDHWCNYLCMSLSSISKGTPDVEYITS